MQTNNNSAPRAVSENIVTQEIGSELIIYNLETHRAMNLNSTVARIWELCDGKNSLEVIRAQAELILNSPLPIEVMELAVSELNKNGLLVKDANSNFMQNNPAVSRRVMIRRAGLAAAVAIPVITALTAPKAAAAASATAALPDGAACATDDQCTNQCCLGGVCQPAAACFV